MFKNQIKSLLAHRVCGSVAHHGKGPVLPLNRDSIRCIPEGCTLEKRPREGLKSPAMAPADVSRLQLLPHIPHRLLWIHLVPDKVSSPFPVAYIPPLSLSPPCSLDCNAKPRLHFSPNRSTSI